MYVIRTLWATINQLNTKKTKIVKLGEKITALTTDTDELTDTTIETGELEDSITDQIVKVLRFIELKLQVERPQLNPTSESNPISQLSGTDSSGWVQAHNQLLLSVHSHLIQMLHIKSFHQLLAATQYLL